MKRLTSKQVKLVKSLLNRLYNAADPDERLCADIMLLADLIRIEMNGTEVPEEQDWSERVSEEVRALRAR